MAAVTIKSWIEASLGTFYNLLTIVLVYGVEEFIRTQLLRCPCDNFALYGSITLVAPTVALLGLGFMMRQEFWKVIAICSKLHHYKIRSNYLLKSLTQLFHPFLPAATFLTFALLRGDFLACAKAGAVKEECGSQKASQEELTRLHVQSQIVGFGFLVGITIFSAGLVLIRRCCFDDESLPTAKEFTELECAALERIFRDKLGEIIEEDLKTKVERAFRSAGKGSACKVFYRARKNVRGLSIKLAGDGSYRPLNIEEDDGLELHSVDVS